MLKSQVLTERPILLFDGDCHFCQFWVHFIMRHEKEETFFFAPLDSNVGKKLRYTYQISNEVDSVIVVKKDQVYLYSDAVIQVLKELQWYVKILTIVKYLPVKWRDHGYRVIAKYRYCLFKKKETCHIPSSHERKRFIG